MRTIRKLPHWLEENFFTIWQTYFHNLRTTSIVKHYFQKRTLINLFFYMAARLPFTWNNYYWAQKQLFKSIKSLSNNKKKPTDNRQIISFCLIFSFSVSHRALVHFRWSEVKYHCRLLPLVNIVNTFHCVQFRFPASFHTKQSKSRFTYYFLVVIRAR